MKPSEFLGMWAGAIVGVALYDHYLGPKWRAFLERVFGK